MDELVFLRDNLVLCKRPMLYSEVQSALSMVTPGTYGHRLTLQSGKAVPTSDMVNATTIYLVPYSHDRISLYAPSIGQWLVYQCSGLQATSPNIGSGTGAYGYDVEEGSNNVGSGEDLTSGDFLTDDEGYIPSPVIATGTSTMNSNAISSGTTYISGWPPIICDLFVWNNNGMLTLQFGTPWASTSARVSDGPGAIVQLNGVHVNAYPDGANGPTIPALSGRYVGSVMLCGAVVGGPFLGYMVDAARYRFLYNAANRVLRPSVASNNLDTAVLTTSLAGVFMTDSYFLNGLSMDAVLYTSNTTLTSAASGQSGFANLYINGSESAQTTYQTVSASDYNMSLVTALAVSAVLGKNSAQLHAGYSTGGTGPTVHNTMTNAMVEC